MEKITLFFTYCLTDKLVKLRISIFHNPCKCNNTLSTDLEKVEYLDFEIWVFVIKGRGRRSGTTDG